MFRERFELRNQPTEHDFMPSLETYILDKNAEEHLRPMIIVCPGGGYGGVCESWEGERVALKYSAAGFCAATLDYCVAPHRYPEALKDIAAAIKLCREKAGEWQVDPKKIIVLGFSAAGHLASNISVEWNNTDIFGVEAVRNRTYRPDLAVLCYPVITGGEGRHEGSFVNLTGSDDPKVWEEHSNEKYVTPDTPPTFLWHTFDDTCVPVVNSMLYAQALADNGVPFELHIYEKGDHGLQTANDRNRRNRPVFNRPYDWVECSIEWIWERFED